MQATLDVVYDKDVFSDIEIYELAEQLHPFGVVTLDAADDTVYPLKPKIRMTLHFPQITVRTGLVEGITSRYFMTLLRTLRTFVGQHSNGTQAIINVLIFRYSDITIIIKPTEYYALTLIPEWLRQIYEALTCTPLKNLDTEQILLPAGMEGIEEETAYSFPLAKIHEEYTYWGIYTTSQRTVTTIYHVPTQAFIAPATFRTRHRW